jgi:hypothetical protein
MESNSNRTLIIALAVAAAGMIFALCACCFAAGVASVVIARRSAPSAQRIEIAPVAPELAPELAPESPQLPELPEIAPLETPRAPETPERPLAPSTPQAPQGVGAGAYIREIIPGGPADEAGLKAGDIVVFVDEQSLLGEQRLADVIASYKPGDKVLLGVIREELPLTVEVTLAEHPDDSSKSYVGVRYVDLVDGDAPPSGD